MNKPYFNNDPNNTVEIFCKQNINGYWIRGQIQQYTPSLHDELSDKYTNALLQLKILAVINNDYLKRYAEKPPHPQFGIITGRDQKDFIGYIKANTKDRWVSLSKKFPDMKIKETDIQVMDIKGINPALDFKIKEIEPYKKHIEEALRTRSPIMLLDLKMSFDRFKSSSESQIKTKYPKGIFSLPAYAFFDNNPDKDKPNYIFNYFEDIFDKIYWNFGYGLLEKREYINILKKIGGLSWQWMTTKTVSKDLIGNLNEFQTSMKGRSNVLLNFCYDFYDDLTEDMIIQEKIAKCMFCGKIFRYRKGKNYCSIVAEDRDCGKKARNRRFYQKHRDDLLPKLRQSSRDYKDYNKAIPKPLNPTETNSKH